MTEVLLITMSIYTRPCKHSCRTHDVRLPWLAGRSRVSETLESGADRVSMCPEGARLTIRLRSGEIVERVRLVLREASAAFFSEAEIRKVRAVLRVRTY